jgi:hypothetical protein
MKCWNWTCADCGACGIEFTEQAAENMLAAHSCRAPLPQVKP